MTKLRQRKVWSHVRQWRICKGRLAGNESINLPYLSTQGSIWTTLAKASLLGNKCCQYLPYSIYLQDWWQAPSSAVGFIPAIYSMSVLLLAICINHTNSFLLMSCIWSLACGFSRESLVLSPYGTVCDETMSNEVFYCNKRLTKWWKEWWDCGSLLDLLLLLVFVLSGKLFHLCTSRSMFQLC